MAIGAALNPSHRKSAEGLLPKPSCAFSLPARWGLAQVTKRTALVSHLPSPLATTLAKSESVARANVRAQGGLRIWGIKLAQYQ